MAADACMIFFSSVACDLRAGAAALRGYGLHVVEHNDRLVACYEDSPQFVIRILSGPTVTAEAREIGAGTSHEAAMAKCDARFDIEIEDLDEELDEINTLIEVQAALQEASAGFLFTPWNGNLSELWKD